ncbi:hypothetical protein SAMN04489712_12510 [Thermomonospora echinospora]|uniref:Uncharacterized protein n=1 Tax=Thermomonospora echinospora TaxID=1992 RepID=A0A1H6DXC8_9ACTN|nr:hypothetical protein [Thermomonospora echinospora]SEG90002.1 hypothetical protein SAMN04489712_12510 [Thermomonospora echinospora]
MSDPYSQGPQQPQYVSGPPQSWTPPQPPPRGKNRGTVVGLVVLAVIVGFIGVAGYLSSKSDPDTAAIGDCVARGSGSSIRVVECTDPASDYKVVGKVPDKTQVQFNISSQRICNPFPTAKSAYWKGESGGKGYVLCLAPVK